MLTHSRNSSKGSVEEIVSHSKQKDLISGVRQKMLLDYAVYMTKYIPDEISSSNSSPTHSAEGSPTAKVWKIISFGSFAAFHSFSAAPLN